MRKIFCVFLLFAVSSKLLAIEYYVATNGSDGNPGTKQQPFLTIQKAADMMRPGDVCIVREGTYREWVKPVRGGTSEAERIVYKTAKGEHVVIKGSEQIKTWVRQNDNVWKVELPDTFFGSFNPFKTNLSGDFLKFGKELHLGCVYLDGKSYYEQMSPNDVFSKPETFFVEMRNGVTWIYANFGSADPNVRLTEISVRECIFFPEIKGLRYITVDGFAMMHDASNWAYFRAFQKGLIGTYYGRHWIIRNCRISDAKCSAIVCGNDPSLEDEGFNADSVGQHVIRNNEIRRCGEAAIHGFKGWAGSVIEGNLIEEINYKKEFGGAETGGIKIHDAVDVIIRNNIIRKVYANALGRYVGIWIDWSAQGTRVTGNVVYDIEGLVLYLQNGHGGPVVVDNNVFSGNIRSTMENCVYVHNLFSNCTWEYQTEHFSPVYWQPHSGTPVKKQPLSIQNDKAFNNIYVGQGVEKISNYPGFQFNWNVFYEGARKSTFGDNESIVDSTFRPNVLIKSLSNGVEVSFNVTKAPAETRCPLISYDFIGRFKLTHQGLEDREGKPYSISTDIAGNPRNLKQPMAGPLEKLNLGGRNTITLIVGNSN